MSNMDNKTIVKHWFISTILTFVGSTLAIYLLRIVYLKEDDMNWSYIIIFTIGFPILMALHEKYKDKIWKGYNI